MTKIDFENTKIVFITCTYKMSVQIPFRKRNLNAQNVILQLLKFALIYSIIWLPSPNTPPY